jgi:hypothetical protein
MDSVVRPALRALNQLFAADLDHVLDRPPAEGERFDVPDLLDYELIRQIADLARAGSVTCEGCPRLCKRHEICS